MTMIKAISNGARRLQSIHANSLSLHLGGARRLVLLKSHRLAITLVDEAKNSVCAVKQTQLRAILQRLSFRSAKSSAAQVDGILQALSLPRNYGVDRHLKAIADAQVLIFAGPDRFKRRLWMHPQAFAAWQNMRQSALLQGIALEVISAFRSQRYQFDLIARKRARGLSTSEILQASAAPGFSEHHSGCALDFCDSQTEPLTEAFADTPSFSWLSANAHRFGFEMSFPRNNRFGVMYEPWHWCYRVKSALNVLPRPRTSGLRARKKSVRPSRMSAPLVFHLVRTHARRAR
jgi:LAS superfamily LD-carboxypeptidase LdcB